MSVVFDLDEAGRRAADEDAAARPLRLEDLPPPAWQGSADALRGLLRPSAAAGRALLMVGAPVAQAVDAVTEAFDAPPDVLGALHAASQPFGTLTMGSHVPDSPEVTAAQDWYFRSVVDDLGSTAVDHWTPNPEDMGSAAKVLNVGGNVVGALPQLFGTPSVFLASAGLDPSTELVRQGVDADTAGLVGGISLAANALGLRLPAAWGTTLTTRLATGTGANLGLGVAMDAASAAVLEANDYHQQAEGYDVTDPYARGLDLLLGAAFGYKAHIDAPALLTPSQRDAVLTARNADHANRQTMPGEPVTPAAAKAHASALGEAIEQMARGEPVNVEQVIRPEDFQLRPELQPEPPAAPGPDFDAAVERVLRDEGGFVDDPDDKGGATNFGISSRAHPDVDVANLTREQAVAIYRDRYWNAIGADALPAEIRGAAFDAAVNQGVNWTRRALAEADGDLESFLRLREDRYRAIAAEDPSQAKFLRGWLNRVGRYRETNEAGVALRERLIADPEQLAREYAQLEDSQGGTVLNTDTARELSPEYLADRTRSAHVHEAASDTIKTIYEAKLAAPTPDGLDPVVMFTAGGTGAGKTTGVKALGDALGRPEIVYDTNMNTLRSALDKIEQALDAGRDVRIVYVYRDPVEAFTGGAIPRAQRQAEKYGSGRTVPLEEHAKTHLGVRPTLEAIAARYADDPRVSITAIDNSRGPGGQQVVELADLPRLEENSLRERLHEALEEARAAGLEESLYRGFLAGGRPSPVLRASGVQDPGRVPPQSGGSDGGRAPQGLDGELAAAQATIDAVAQMTAELPHAQVIDGFDADGNPRYRSAAEVLAEIQAEQAQAMQDATAYKAAADCYIRRGGDAS